MRKWVFFFACMITFSPISVANDDWLVGKWQLTFDPDGAETDYLEFLANGDAFSQGPLGRMEGLYLVSGDRVKAVFSYKGRDFIMTFFFNDRRDELRIITSHTGRASIYKKLVH